MGESEEEEGYVFALKLTRQGRRPPGEVPTVLLLHSFDTNIENPCRELVGWCYAIAKSFLLPSGGTKGSPKVEEFSIRVPVRVREMYPKFMSFGGTTLISGALASHTEQFRSWGYSSHVCTQLNEQRWTFPSASAFCGICYLQLPEWKQGRNEWSVSTLVFSLLCVSYDLRNGWFAAKDVTN